MNWQRSDGGLPRRSWRSSGLPECESESVQDRPTAAELLEALSDFMRNRAENARDRWERFQFQVAANSISIIKREIEMEDGLKRAEWAGLDRLLGGEEMPVEQAALAQRLNERNAELVERIRNGDFDGQAEERLLPHLWETVVNNAAWRARARRRSQSSEGERPWTSRFRRTSSKC